MKKSNIKFLVFAVFALFVSCSTQQKEMLTVDAGENVNTGGAVASEYISGNIKYYHRSDYHLFLENILKRVSLTFAEQPEDAIIIENTRLVVNKSIRLTMSSSQNDDGDPVLDFMLIDPNGLYGLTHNVDGVPTYTPIPNRVIVIDLNESVSEQIEIHSPTEATFFVTVTMNDDDAPHSSGGALDKVIHTSITVNISDNVFRINNFEIGRIIEQPQSDVQLEDMFFRPSSADKGFEPYYFSYNGTFHVKFFRPGYSSAQDISGRTANGWKRVKVSDTHYQIHVIDGYYDFNPPLNDDALFLSGQDYHTFDFYLKSPVGPANTITADNIDKIRVRSDNLNPNHLDFTLTK